jgi:hypothetical protein
MFRERTKQPLPFATQKEPSYGNEQRGENCEIKNISSQCVSRGKYEDASGNQSEKNG